MAIRIHLVGVALALTLAGKTSAQSSAAANPIGTWRGTSTCLVHPSPCNDEIVVYRITPMKSPDSVSLAAFKIVRGQEEDMGVLNCLFTVKDGQLACAIPRGVWHFTVRGDSLTGELRRTDNTKFRDVRATRNTPTPAPPATSPNELAAQQAAWKALGVSDYAFSYRDRCFCSGSYVWVRITVHNSNVANTQMIRAETVRAGLDSGYRRPTIDSLFAWISDAYKRNSETVDVAYDPQYHFPLSAQIDGSTTIIDDEFEFAVQDFTPLGPAVKH